MAFPYSWDAESGLDFDDWDVGEENNTLTQSSTKKNSGTYAYRGYYGTPAETDLYCENDITAATELWYRLYVNFDEYSIDTGDYNNFITLRMATASVATVTLRPVTGGMKIRYTVYENSGSTRVYDGSTNDISPTDGWICIEIHLKAGNGDGGGEIWLDGNSLGSDFTLTNDTKIGAGVVLVRTGTLYGNPASAGSIFYWDDMYVDDSYIGLLSVGYTITAALGTFALTGVAVSFILDYLISAVKAAFTLTGIATNLLKDSLLSLITGSINLTGKAVTLLKQSKISIVSQSFSLTGFTSNFYYGVGTLIAAVSSFLLTGKDILLSIIKNDPGYNPLICFKREPHKIDRHEPIERKDPKFNRRDRQCDD